MLIGHSQNKLQYYVLTAISGLPLKRIPSDFISKLNDKLITVTALAKNVHGFPTRIRLKKK